MITARRLMEIVVSILRIRCDGGAAQQGHAVSVRQIPTQHRFGCECDQQHGDERDCASSSPSDSAASQPALWCQHSDYYPSCGNLLLSFVVLIASVLSQLQRGLRWLALRLTPVRTNNYNR